MRPFYTYSSAGVYTARLTVVDGAGLSNSTLATVTVATNLAPNVLCVPYRGNVNLPHPTHNGRAIRLKAVVRDAGTVSNRWTFGDGSTSTITTAGDKYQIEATHTYTGGVGQIFYASLTVWDSAGLCTTDRYPVVVMESNQETRAQIAVDEGLWWLHCIVAPDLGRSRTNLRK
jgi:PKD repeat protein